MTKRIARFTKAWMGLAAITAALTACSAGTGGQASSGSVASGAASASAADTSQTLPSMEPITKWFGPAKAFAPSAHKHIMILECGAAGNGCVRIASGAKAAVEALGWTADVVDGQLNPAVWNQAVKQAADSGVAGIIDISGNPNVMGDAMAAVRAHHVPFVLAEQSPRAGDQSGIGAYIYPDPVAGGSEMAQWIARDSGGSAHVLILDVPGFLDVMSRNDAIVNGLKGECKQCVTYRVNVSPQTFGTTLAPDVTSLLQQHPDINYVWAPDDAVSDFVAQGIQQAGKTSSVKLVSGAGVPEVLAKIKTGQEAADLATGDQWEGWLDTDTLARLIAGQPVQNWKEPQRLWTAVNISQASADTFVSGWNPEFAYEAGFKKLWGLG